RLPARPAHPGADPVSAADRTADETVPAAAAPAAPAPGSPAPPAPEPAPPAKASPAWTLAGLAVVVLLAWLVSVLTDQAPELTAGTWFGNIAESIEYPVYAIALGFAGNTVLSATGVRRRMAAAFRTEFFIKIGLVLLGATVNFAIVVRAAGPAVLQAILLITVVFAFSWLFDWLLGLGDRMRALLASDLSFVGFSAV